MGAPGNISGESNALMVQVPCMVFFVLTPIFFTVRIWSRLKLRSGFGWDDWTILVSFICCMTVSVLMMASVHYGFGQHIFNIEKSNRIMAMKLFYVAQIFYKLTINLTKSSILLLYLRLFSLHRPFRITCIALLTVILLYCIATTASSIFQCTPIPRAWNRSIPGTCISLTYNWYANAIFSISTDVAIILLPQRVIWKSQLPTSHKRALMGVFGLGVFVTVTSILRMTTLNFSTRSPDPTCSWPRTPSVRSGTRDELLTRCETIDDIASTLWTMIEIHVAIICACLPMCRLPLAYLFPSILGTTAKTSPSNATSASEQPQGAPDVPLEPLPTRGGDVEKGEGNPAAFVRATRGDSEEYILRPLTGQGRGEDEEEHREGGPESGIQKTMWFEMRSERSTVAPGQAM
ncbi:integral membrane protein [Verticillium alfalfae VaMs.102]|uniref:Integral membrane protein n=1 Tax=Verticillium alfalfae (strain VaMs.102 / ATCC MYA-4576 / FGSC 10136) TaxID=526221 RepID=C9SVY1_VERA1|nr:integral membrane protein [Verticillium alfalfae VaMs.102]EEY22946.1 integral membrane protein [Verticillium alfalfae VaMs.102]